MSFFLGDKLWRQKDLISPFVLMVSSSSQTDETPWAVWFEPKRQQPGKTSVCPCIFSHHHFATSSPWNLDESCHVFCVRWGLSWVFQETVASVWAEATTSVRKVTGTEPWWWKSLGSWGSSSVCGSCSLLWGQTLGHLEATQHALPSVVCLLPLRTHLFKFRTASWHPLSQYNQRHGQVAGSLSQPHLGLPSNCCLESLSKNCSEGGAKMAEE